MRILLVSNPAAPNGEDAFCREIARRASARGHVCADDAADVAIVNGPQISALSAAASARVPTLLRLIDPSDPASEELKRRAPECSRVLVPGAYMKEVVSGWGVPAPRITVVPYAYDHLFTAQIALVTLRAARPSSFGLVTSGVVDSSSLPGFETVLSAVSRLRLDCRVDVIGDGPALETLKSKARTLMLGARAAFLGDLPVAKKMEYLRAAKAYIEPSQRQGFPSFALHAMSEGCPVVGADAGAVPELVKNGENGLLYRPGDAGSLAEQLLNLASTPGLSLKLIAGGVRAVEGRSWDATVSRVLDAVESLEVKA